MIGGWFKRQQFKQGPLDPPSVGLPIFMEIQIWWLIKNKLPRHGQTILVAWKDSKHRKNIVVGTFWKRYAGTQMVGWYIVYCDIEGVNELDDSQVVGWQRLPKFPKHGKR